MQSFFLSFLLVTGVILITQAQTVFQSKVTDPAGKPIAGVNISAAASGVGAASDDQGRFTLTGLKAGIHTLTFSALGYRTQHREFAFLEGVTIVPDILLVPASYLLDEIGIAAARAGENTPIAFQEISAEELERNNLGQDLPYLLRFTPSMAVNSDAGTGIGYTGMRLRGADITRINVTLNGIPVNDSESHAVFWVNMPDLGSSLSDLQIQRGVGTSTNGSGAFGASIHLNTQTLSEKPYASSFQALGSFNTWMRHLKLGTGNLGGGLSLDARLSRITSDGYIDRATARLGSYAVSATLVRDRNVLRLHVLDGRELTYQAWNGVPMALAGDRATRTFNSAGMERPGSPHPNEVDNYRQTHYQAHWDQSWTAKLTSSLGIHYTRGAGYFEQYRSGQQAADYRFFLPVGIEPGTAIDVIRRRWLDNHFFGSVFALTYQTERLESVLGGAWHRYLGNHFGELTWASIAGNTYPDHRYYDNDAVKGESNMYWKNELTLAKNLKGWTDLQVRRVTYQFEGIDDTGQKIPATDALTFFNPKVGLQYGLPSGRQVFASFAVAHREPNRDDYVDNPRQTRPRPEVLRDLELGMRSERGSFPWECNGFLMLYRNHLVQTGRLNDVGAYIRENVSQSFRLGVEVQTAYLLEKVLELQGNLAWSLNRILDYTAYFDEYDGDGNWIGQATRSYRQPDLAFSPGWIGAASIRWFPFGRNPWFSRNPLSLSWQMKYVGRQFLDNTGDISRSLPAFLIHDAALKWKMGTSLSLSANILNVADVLYANNGWVYTSITRGRLQSDIGVYPQAGRHAMITLEIGW